MFFLGAGFGKAAGLPNTAELLTAVHELSDANQHWGVSREIGTRLDVAYGYFYPDHGTNFRPEVSDFFTMLATYMDISGEGLPQGFPDRTLLTDLKFAIAQILSDRSKAAAPGLVLAHPVLDAIIQPGNVVITSNWDVLIEKAAQLRGIPVRLSGPPADSSLVLLKLHGSVDWSLRIHCKHPVGIAKYASLENLMFSARSRPQALAACKVVRVQALESWTRMYQIVKGYTSEPFMLTMARGKSDRMDPLLPIWTDAYRALSSAGLVHVIGYSMPSDDVEIRTLLRAGYERGALNPRVVVRNPSPEVHVRFRTQVTREIESDYRPVPPIGKG